MLNRHLPQSKPAPDTLSPVRLVERAGEVKLYQYPSLSDSPWLVLVRQGQDGLLWPMNSLARALCEFSGMPYLDAHRIQHLKAEGFTFEAVQAHLRKL